MSDDATAVVHAAKILVVDDMPIVLRAVTRMLQRLGFEVVGTTQPIDALARAIDPLSAFTAIVTDIDMPELSGPELLLAVAAAGIIIPAILISGRAEDALGRPVLEKPFTEHALRAALRVAGIGIPR